MSTDFSARSSSSSGSTRPDAAAGELSTTNARLAALLRCHGIEPLRVDPPAPGVYPRFASFVFPRSPELNSTLDVWKSNSTTELNPREYAEYLAELQRIARASARGGGQ